MGPGAWSTDSNVPLKWGYCIGSSGHQETGGEPEPRGNCRKSQTSPVVVALIVVSSALIAAVIALAVLFSKRSSAALGPACADGWVGYRGKCYNFSETEGNWTNSQRHCSSLSASLAVIDSEQEMLFVLRLKGKFDHWIGLRRDPGQPWKWANGTEFNNLFPIGGRGDCAYLTDLGGVSSLRCTSERHWICTKPDAFTQAQEAAVEGDS